jgi:hypothetical protein
MEKNERGACSTYGEKRGVTGFWEGNLRAKRPLGRSRIKWKDNIKMGIQEVGCGG